MKLTEKIHTELCFNINMLAYRYWKQFTKD